MDPEDFQTDSEPEESYLPEGLGSDVDEHAISSSGSEGEDEDENNDDDGTPKMSPDYDFNPAEQDLGALIAQRGEVDTSEPGPSLLTSSFLSLPENLSQEDLLVKKAQGAKEPKEKGKKRTKRKAKSDAKGGDMDVEPKKKKKKSKKDGNKDGNKKGKEKKRKESGDKNKRRNIKTFLKQNELEAETLRAQQEEEERKQRLEEQRALNADLATLSELLSDDVPSQPSQPLLHPPPPTSSAQPPPSGLFPPLQQTSQHPSSSSTSSLPTSKLPPPLAAPLHRMPLPVPVLTPELQSQMMKQFPSSNFRSFAHMPPFMPGLSMPRPPPKTVDGCIVLDDSSGDEESIPKKSGREDDVIQISSGDEDVTVVSDGSGKEDGGMEEEYEEEGGDEESSGVHSNDVMNVPDAYGRVLVNVAHPPDEPDIFLPEHLAGVVKPHQIGGIRFLYDNLVESLNRFKSSAGFGCILAHSMGLGKTLQLITFTDIFMRYTGAKTVLCIVPINTLQNWVAEFDMWLPARTESKGDNEKNSSSCEDAGSRAGESSSNSGATQGRQRIWRQFGLYVVNDMHKTTDSRLSVIDEWYTAGGVLLMGYEMYRLLCSRKQTRARKKTAAKRKTQVIDLEEEDRKEGMIMDIRRALVKPGPDLVICDEGHRIKNSLAGISQALKNIRTRRRVVLTGYPLQNNLQEYWCMVDFVRPNFLGTKHEFANLFERPISNGQCMDSTPNDVRLMQHRAHVLHKLLEGFVQRRGFKVLKTALPPKEEHVLLVRLTTFQRGLYIRFMQRFTEAGAAGWCNTNPLKAFSVACKIWNHPDVLCEVLQTREGLDSDADLDLPEFNPKSKCKKKGNSKDKDSSNGNGSCEGTESGKSSPSMDLLAAAGAASSRSSAPVSIESYQDKVNEILSFEWARDLMKNYQQNKIANSSKMVLLFKILEDSIKMGDKVLVFSQSLMTLSVIEKFLSFTPIPQPDNPPPDMPKQWVRNSTYFRLDGSTPVSEREKMINEFNAPNNQLWLFILSTRAGSLGINLIGANKVIVLDASWNPCHDAQAVCRVYRYGQTKKCHVYRMVTDNTLEKKIYDRQVSKKGMSDRVVDEMNPEMNLTKKEVESLLEFDESDMPFEDFSHMADKFTDPILKDICAHYSNTISKVPFTTESLLTDRRDRRLTKAEKRQAESNFEAEKKLNLSYSRPSYAAYYAQGGAGKQRINIDPNAAAHASALPSSFMSRYTNRPVANVRPIQSTPVPKTPMNNMQQRLSELRNAGVTVQKITATTDIILPGTTTLSSSNPLIRAGEQVTFIKTQKGVYLRTTDGRILAVRGAQPTKPSSSSTASGGLPLGQGIAPTLSTASFQSDTLTTQSGAKGAASSSGSQQRHQLADLLREKVEINLSSDSDPDSDFFDPFKSPRKTPKKPGVGQDFGRPNSSGYAKPATCTVSPGVQSVPLASTLPLGPFGNQTQQSGSPSTQPNSPPSDVNNPVTSSSTTNSETLSTPASVASNLNLNEDLQSSADLLNQMSDFHFPNHSTENSRSSTPSATPTSAANPTTSNSNSPATSSPNTSMPQQHPMSNASNYGMPYFPGMVPMPSTTGNSQQQQQPPIVINYQLPPMPPGAMMQPGFMPYGFPPMMYPPGQMQNQGGSYPGGMFPRMPGQGQMPMGQGQYPMGQEGQNQTGQGQSNQSETPRSSADSVNQKITETEQDAQSAGSTTNA